MIKMQIHAEPIYQRIFISTDLTQCRFPRLEPYLIQPKPSEGDLQSHLKSLMGKTQIPSGH